MVLLRHLHYQKREVHLAKIRDSKDMCHETSMGNRLKEQYVTLWLVCPLFTSPAVACAVYVSTKYHCQYEAPGMWV